MMFTVIISFYFLYSMPTYGNANKITRYQESINEIFNFEALGGKLRAELTDLPDADDLIIRMIDASTKIPSGFLAGNYFDLGHFDECYGIKSQDSSVYGKYCLGTLAFASLAGTNFEDLTLNTTQRRSVGVHPQPRLIGLGAGYAGIHWAACIPSTLPASSISDFLLTFTEEFCYSKASEPEFWTTGAIVTVFVLCFILALVILSTGYDLYLYYSNNQTLHELLLAFSIFSNGKKILKASTHPDQLLCLNGIKAISMMWVILGHEYANVMNAPFYNALDAAQFIQESPNMFVVEGTVSVDTFFVVGGLVTVYTFMKAMDKGVKFNVILYYIHRYLRLTPAFVILALIHMYLINFVANGPLWKIVDVTLVQPCETGWWSSFIYMTNYVKKGICLPQTWYLSVDMQLFILSPLVLMPLSMWPLIGLGILGCLTIAGCVVPFVIGYVENLGSMFDTAQAQAYMDVYYMQTYARFGPYVIGMIMGYLLHKIKKGELRINYHLSVVALLWLVSLTGLTACIWAGYPIDVATEEDKWGNAMFLAFRRNAWAVAVCGVIFLCVTGYGHPVDKFLSLPVFQFLTKLSYSMYLVHYSVITMRYASMKNTMKFSHSAMMYNFWSDFMVTMFLSVVLCLSCESPVIVLEKYLIKSIQYLTSRVCGKERSTLAQNGSVKKPEV